MGGSRRLVDGPGHSPPPQESPVAQVRLDSAHLEPRANLLVRSRCHVGWMLRRTAELCSLPPFSDGPGPHRS
eukprot:134627-Pyramimonas_sp.AAC.1